MENPIKLIHKFNVDAGLIEKGYDDFLESSFQIEEALEGLPNIEAVWEKVKYDNVIYNKALPTPKEVSRQIIHRAIQGSYGAKSNFVLSDVDRLDKACDAVVFAVGSMAKLGLNPQEITKALNVVMHANNAKLKCPKDEFGKLTKPADFVGPEPELQKILDKRSK